jgi:hypothetical protein
MNDKHKKVTLVHWDVGNHDGGHRLILFPEYRICVSVHVSCTGVSEDIGFIFQYHRQELSGRTEVYTHVHRVNRNGNFFEAVNTSLSGNFYG